MTKHTKSVHISDSVIFIIIHQVQDFSGCSGKSKKKFQRKASDIPNMNRQQWCRKVSDRRIWLTKFHWDWQNFIFLLHILLFRLTRFSKLVQMTGMPKKISTSLRQTDWKTDQGTNRVLDSSIFILLQLQGEVTCTFITVCVYWLLYNVTTIFQLYMWQHIDLAVRVDWGTEEEVEPLVGLPGHRYFVEFFNVPVQAPTRFHPSYIYSEKLSNFSRFLRRAWRYGGPILILNPWVTTEPFITLTTIISCNTVWQLYCQSGLH